MAYNHRGLALDEKRDYPAAIKDFDQAIKLNANSTYYFNNRGFAYRNNGETDRAIADYQPVHQAQGGIRARLLQPWHGLLREARFRARAQDMNQAIKLNPNYAATFHDRGVLYYDKNRYDPSIPEADQAIKIVANYPISFNKQGNSYESKREDNRVIQEVDQAIKVNSAPAIAIYNRGNIQLAARDYPGAIQLYDQVIAMQPANADAWTNRCGARSLSGDLPSAVNDCNEAIKLKANNGSAFDNRGLVNLKMGQLEQAIVDYDAALKLNPKLPGALFGRGMAKLARGDTSGSSDIEAAKSLKPNIAEIFAKSGVNPEILAKKEPPEGGSPAESGSAACASAAGPSRRPRSNRRFHQAIKKLKGRRAIAGLVVFGRVFRTRRARGRRRSKSARDRRCRPGW